MILPDLHHPGAMADRKASQGYAVAGVELALRKKRAVACLRDHRRKRCRGENDCPAGKTAL
jgi:hypothetical protein